MFFYFCHQKFGSHMKMCCLMTVLNKYGLFMFMSLKFWYSHEIVLHMWMSFFKGVAPEGEIKNCCIIVQLHE